MSDKIMELRSETNDNEGEKFESNEENEQLEEGNEASKTGNSQLMQPEEPTESTIAIPTTQSDLSTSGLELEEAEYYVPNWLIEVLAFIYHKEMANSSLSTISKLFQLLCWPKLHQKVKPHKIPYLICTAIRDELGNLRAQFQRLETYQFEIIQIASTPAPHYIDGIKTIYLGFVNEQIVDFFKNIDRLLQNCDLGVSFHFNSRAMHKNVTSMHALLEYLANKIMRFSISYDGWRQKPYLNDFNRQFPGILDQIQFLSFDSIFYVDNFDTTLKWMTKQSNDGKQKIIKFGHDVIQNYKLFIRRIKKKFINSNSASIFFIYFVISNQNFEEFTLENAQTNEILIFYHGENQWDSYSYYIMARYPKGEEHWKEDGLNKIEDAQLSDSVIFIDA